MQFLDLEKSKISDYEDFVFSDEDDEILERIERRDYVIYNRTNPFDDYDEVDFYRRFRLDKATVAVLLGLITNQLTFLTER